MTREEHAFMTVPYVHESLHKTLQSCAECYQPTGLMSDASDVDVHRNFFDKTIICRSCYNSKLEK